MYIKNKNKFLLFILFALSVLYSEDYKSKNMNANQIYMLSDFKESLFKNERIISKIPLQRHPTITIKIKIGMVVFTKFFKRFIILNKHKYSFQL